MSIFSDVKQYVTARQVAEHYGLKIKHNGMACCPFHHEKHPSMKVDSFYYCFACGEKGDAINYVSKMFELTPYAAACKIVEDFGLPVETRSNGKVEMERMKLQWRREKKEQAKLKVIKKIFSDWCNAQVRSLKECLVDIEIFKGFIGSMEADIWFESDVPATIFTVEQKVNYWLDILCTGTDEEKKTLFVDNRKEVENIVGQTFGIGERLLGPDWPDIRGRIQYGG